MESIDIAKDLVRHCLQQGDNVEQFDEDTQLLGALPEMNSLTIMTMVTSLEEQLGVEISDEELSAEIFETIGSLARFIDTKL